MSDEELLDDYFRVMGHTVSPEVKAMFLPFVRTMRADEPRLNCGAHLVDYCNICDADDTMDSFYGSDYPWETPRNSGQPAGDEEGQK